MKHVVAGEPDRTLNAYPSPIVNSKCLYLPLLGDSYAVECARWNGQQMFQLYRRLFLACTMLGLM